MSRSYAVPASEPPAASAALELTPVAKGGLGKVSSRGSVAIAAGAEEGVVAADIRVTMDEWRVPARPLRLLPAVTAYCRQLFPSDAEVVANNTRVRAEFDLGDNVRASAVIDVDPVYDDPEQTRLSGWLHVWGADLNPSDRPAIERIAEKMFDGLRAVVTATLNGTPGPRVRRGFGGLDL